MMRHLAVIAFLWGLPTIGLAQDVTVRSGEHQGYSRLVFDFPGRVPWSLDQAEDAAILRFEGSDFLFNTDAVFDRLQRDRIRAVTVGQDKKSVSISLNCNCAVRGFWHGRAMLVVDINDTDPAQPRESEKQKKSARKTSPIDRAQAVGKTPIALTSSTPSTSASLLRRKLDRLADMPTPPDAPLAVPSRPRPDVLDQSREQLIRELGRAATQGLLSPATDLSTPTKPAVESAETPATRTTEKPTSPPVRDPTANMHINVQTSVDRAFLSSLSDRSESLLSGACLPSSQVDVSAWGTDAPFWEQIGPLRRSLSSEFDRTDEDVATRLARTYLYFGFGIEARELLVMLPPNHPDKPVLYALADVMEAGSAPGSALAGQLDCDGQAALWSALSYETLPRNTRLDTDAVQRGFAALPKHLRSHLGPTLSRRFLDAGLTSESSMILRVLDRVDETQSAKANLVKADIEMSSGDAPAAEAMLDTVVAANSEPSAQALVRRIDSLVARNEDVSFDVAQLAAAYAHEHAGTALGASLSRAHVLALAASGVFDAAFTEVDKMDRDQTTAAVALRAELTTRLVGHAEEMEFLRHALAGHVGSADTLEPDTALEVADRLLQAGFLEQAEQSLSSDFDGPASRRAKLMRADIALSRGFPRRAEVELLGLDGRDVNILRARARSMVGEHKQAHDLFKSAGLQDEADREAWLAREWAQPAEPASAEQLAALESDSGTEQEQGVLSQNRALLQTSAEARESLEMLLSERPAPNSTEN